MTPSRSPESLQVTDNCQRKQLSFLPFLTRQLACASKYANLAMTCSSGGGRGPGQREQRFLPPQQSIITGGEHE
jgi:hypothetical protein